MLHLQRLQFTGFKDQNKIVSVHFSASTISVIYGDNGSGKTSFLRAISAFLSQEDATLAQLGIRSIKCDYLHDDLSYSLEVERKEISYDWSSFVESPLKEAKSIALGVERGISTQSMRVEADVIYEFFRRSPRARRFFQKDSEFLPRELAEELSFFLKRRHHSMRDRPEDLDDRRAHQNLQNIKLENIEQLLLNHYRQARYSANLKIQSALFNTLSDAIDKQAEKSSRIPLDIHRSIFEYRERLIEALTNDEAESNEFKITIVRILTALTEENYPVEVESKPLLRSLFSNMIEELEKEKLALGAINLLVDTFNKYLIENKKLVVSGSEIFVSIGADRHSIHDLSSGERHILTFLSLVLFLGQEKDFLIIDEPEISLNITWQRQLLELFKKLVPKTQIIVASHSPVLSKRHPEFLTPLRTEKRSVT